MSFPLNAAGSRLAAVMADHNKGPQYALVECIHEGCTCTERLEHFYGVGDETLVAHFVDLGWSIRPTLCPEHNPDTKHEHDFVGRMLNSVDMRMLPVLLEGSLKESVAARIGQPITSADLYHMLLPILMVLDDDSPLHEQVCEVLDLLCTPADRNGLDDGSALLTGGDLHLWRAPLPVADEDLPRLYADRTKRRDI